MSSTWTSEQILAMAPDASSAKNGQGLANPRKWVTLGYDDRAIWGECQGSGSKPYQTQIDLKEIAFKCSCPSRKFPCKHGLGLFLIFATQPSIFNQNLAPNWVNTWINNRTEKQDQKTETIAKDQSPEAEAKRAAKQAKTIAQRQDKVASGIQELDIWLRDIVRQGLAAVQGQPYSFWDGVAARMVDAQARLIARNLRIMGSVAASGEGWQEKLLERLGKLHLLVEGYKRLETLPPDIKAEILANIDWQFQQEPLESAKVCDRWLVLGQIINDIEGEKDLLQQRTWLWGINSDRPALLLESAYSKAPQFDKSFVPGYGWEGEIYFYQSTYPLRGIFKNRSHNFKLETFPGYNTINSMQKSYANAIALNPWLNDFPIALKNVNILQYNNTWMLRDTEDFLLPILPNFSQGWHLLALSGGHSFAIFGEWNGDYLRPFSAYCTGEFMSFS